MLLLGCGVCAMAQLAPERKDIYRGNKLFSVGELDNAIVEYRKALQKDSTSYSANYNLANTSYTAAAAEESANGKVAKYEEAAKYLDKVLETDPTFEAWFNKGNVLMQQENYQQAVDAYKEALLLNPGDMDAKRNYIYARQKAQEQQDQQQNQNNDQNQQNQDQNNDQQNQDQNKDQNQQDNNQGQQNNQNQNNDQNNDQNDNKRDQDNKNNDQNKDQNQDQNKDQDRDNNKNNQDSNRDQNQEGNSQPQQGKMDPRQAEQLLQAIADKEKKTQEKVREAEAAKAASSRSDKNW